MPRLTKNPLPSRANRELSLFCEWAARGRCRNGLRVLLLAAATITTLLLSACGGSSASGGSQQSATLSGNWQFAMAEQMDGNPSDPSFSGGMLGGFFLQNNGSASGQTVYSVALTPTQSNPSPTPCNSGSAPVAVVITGQNVTITEVAGTQTFTLTGTLSSDGSTMMGTYTSTAGTAPNGSPCGYAETGLSWSAVSVPPLTGSIQGSFHSRSSNSDLANQDFPVSGSLTQGQNIGASNATVTGTLNFIDPTTLLSNYPCFSVASVNGQISGNTVILQIIGIDGSNLGQIGGPVNGTTGLNPVTFDSVQGGYILHGVGPSYLVASKPCPGSPGGVTIAGDAGDICVALGSIGACQQPIILSPAVVIFPAQAIGSAATTQIIALTNNTGSTLSPLTLNFSNNADNQFEGESDFNGLPSFTEQDTCAASPGSAFALGSGQSCSITLAFSPQLGCPWLPFPQSGNGQSILGASPEYCPFAQSATVTVTSPSSEDNDKSFAVPITGLGLSAIQPSTRELDFGAEAASESSLPQTLSLTNNSLNPVQILGRANCLNQSANSHNTLPSPRLTTSSVAGLQVVSNDVFQISPDLNSTPATITYRCDSDPGTLLPNFQISSDTCTGTVLPPQTSCSLQIAYVPQPSPLTQGSGGLDYFLELNTVQCWPAGTLPSSTDPCEIDSGRFPVELKSNGPSSLRMSPSAGLDFGNQATGKTSAPLQITLLNDPALANPQTVTFVGKILVQGNYSETDDCPVTLSPGSSCTLTVTFKPGSAGFIPGKLTINYTQESNSGIVTTGNPQFIYLRGTGQ